MMEVWKHILFLFINVRSKHTTANSRDGTVSGRVIVGGGAGTLKIDAFPDWGLVDGIKTASRHEQNCCEHREDHTLWIVFRIWTRYMRISPFDRLISERTKRRLRFLLNGSCVWNRVEIKRSAVCRIVWRRSKKDRRRRKGRVKICYYL